MITELAPAPYSVFAGIIKVSPITGLVAQPVRVPAPRVITTLAPVAATAKVLPPPKPLKTERLTPPVASTPFKPFKPVAEPEEIEPTNANAEAPRFEATPPAF